MTVLEQWDLLFRKTAMIESNFKNTEIGIMPVDWDIVRLGSCSEIYRGGSPRPIEDYITNLPNGINWVKIGDVAVGDKYINHTKEKIIPEGASRSRRVFKGDFLLSNSMSFGRPYILEIDGCIHDGWLVIQNYNSTFNKDYLYYCLGSDKVYSQYISMAAGSSVLNLNKEKVADVLLPLPPIEEQKSISDALGKIDRLIDSLNKLIVKKLAIKQGTMQLLLTGKKRLNGFRENWILKKLGNTCTIKARIGWQGLTTNEYLTSGDYYLITGTDFNEGQIDWKHCHYVSKERYEQDKSIQIRDNDILITKDGTIGKVAFLGRIPKNGTLNSGVFVVRSNDSDINQEYLGWVFLSKYFTDFIDKLTAGSTIQHLYQKDIVSFVFPIPPSIEEQKAIASILNKFDSDIASLKAKRDKYLHIKQGMMQELLTGKIRLV